VDVLGIVREVVSQIEGITENVTFRIDGNPLWIEGDPGLLRRAIENLVRNAVEAIAEKGGPGTVTIVAERSSLTISDEGAGVDESEVAKLLLPFQSTKPNGFGLGLPLARKIILHHGGTLRLTGARGVGAQVRIDFGEGTTRDPARLDRQL
jgi:signal transduction histidine kinase